MSPSRTHADESSARSEEKSKNRRLKVHEGLYIDEVISHLMGSAIGWTVRGMPLRKADDLRLIPTTPLRPGLLDAMMISSGDVR